MAVFHYSRVSREDLSTSNQQHAAQQSVYKVDYWFADENTSGAVKAAERPEFAKMLSQMIAGDVLVVSAVDRIGRNTVDVISTVENFQKMGVKVCVLAYGSLDLTSDIGMVVLSLAATFAQLERSSIRTRTKAGMERTKAQGTKLGQPLKIAPQQLTEMFKMEEEGINVNQIALKFGMQRNTVNRNMITWRDNLGGYAKEYNTRQEQYRLSKLPKGIKVNP